MEVKGGWIAAGYVKVIGGPLTERYHADTPLSAICNPHKMRITLWTGPTARLLVVPRRFVLKLPQVYSINFWG